MKATFLKRSYRVDFTIFFWWEWIPCGVFHNALQSVCVGIKSSYLWFYFSAWFSVVQHFQSTWMGINDNNKEDAFEWSDGSPFAFINWRDGGRKWVLTFYLSFFHHFSTFFHFLLNWVAFVYFETVEPIKSVKNTATLTWLAMTATLVCLCFSVFQKKKKLKRWKIHSHRVYQFATVAPSIVF